MSGNAGFSDLERSAGHRGPRGRPSYTAPVLERWTRVVIGGRAVVIACWVVVIVVGSLSTLRLPRLLSTSLAVPGTASERADTILTQHFGQNIEGTFTVVFRVEHPSALETRSLDQRFAVAARAVPGARATTLQAGAGILYGYVGTSLDLQRAAAYTGVLRQALKEAGIPRAYVTGAPALQHDITPILASDLHKGEIIALLAALALLTVVLGLSLCVLFPFAVAAGTITGVLAIIYGLAHEFLMVLYIPNLVELIGLGLAIDYSLLVVHRFKEELADSERPVDDAIVMTMATAGRTVIISGVAVAIGLSVLLVIPVPFVRSLGLAGLLVPLVSILAALTLQPALLSILGRPGTRSAWPAWLGERRDAGGGLWAEIARMVMRRPVLVFLGSSAVLVLAAAPVVWLQLTPGSVTAIPQGIGSARGLSLLRQRVGPGVVAPIEVVLDAGAPNKVLAPAVSAATLRLARDLLDDPEVFVVDIGSRPPNVDPSGRYGRIVVVGRHDFGDEASQQLVREIRRLVPAARFPTGVRVYVGGAPAQGVDFLNRVYGIFPVGRSPGPRAHLPRTAPGVSLPPAPSHGTCPRRCLGRRDLWAARRDLPLRRRRRHPRALPRLANRGVGPGLSFRDALRSLHGLRGLLRHSDAGVLGRTGPTTGVP